MSPAGDDEKASDDAGPPTDPGPPDERVLDPEDLEFTRREEVAELDEGKFVIGTEGPPNPDAIEGQSESSDPTSASVEKSSSQQQSAESADRSPQAEPGLSSTSTPGEFSARDVKRWLNRELERTDSYYAYRIAAKNGETISHQQLASDDINMAFDSLLLWYAQQVGEDTAVEEVLGILLGKSSIRVRIPIALLTEYLKQHELAPDDTVADLLETVRDEDGLVLPRKP